MDYYTKKIEVDIHDVDYNGVARASSIMKFIQSAAQSQLTDNGLSYEQLKSKKRAFLLSKIKLDFGEAVRAYEPLTAVTYPCDSRGYSFLRCYSLERNGETVARAVSIWALIDTETHALVRVNDFDLGLETFSPNGMDLTRISPPSEMLTVGTYRVSYGTVDQNRHMNNTVYPDMYSEFLPLDGKRIRTMSIYYINEAPINEELTVLRGYHDGIYYFRTVRADGRVNTESEITLTDI